MRVFYQIHAPGSAMPRTVAYHLLVDFPFFDKPDHFADPDFTTTSMAPAA